MKGVEIRLRGKTIILAAVLLFITAGCITVEKKVQPIEEESLEIVELKKAVSGLYMKSEEMNNRLFLLQEKLDSSNDRLNSLEGEEEGTTEEIDAETDSELKVDELKDEEIDVESVFEEKVAEPYTILSDNAVAVQEPQEDAAALLATAEPLATAEELYESAMKDLNDKNYAQARAIFQKIYENYPEHSLADNAIYWTGETYYVERDYNGAIESFEAVISRYPDGNKAADALLKTAYSYISLKDRDNTIKALNLLMDKYPDSEAAAKANERFRKKK